MSATTIQQNIIYGIGEGASVANSTMLSYALRWANNAYREMYTRLRFKNFQTRAVFRTSDGQETYQAPADMIGFLILKDEENNETLDQITPEEFSRDVSSKKVTDESFTTTTLDTAVELDNQAILQYSETVTNTDGDTEYTRDTDYTMAYASGTITPITGGSMAAETEYYIDYLYRQQNKPKQFCLEYDGTNKRWVFRIDPVPDDTYIYSLIYPAAPTVLSSTEDAIWSSFEFCLERGGIYYGSLEVIDDVQKRQEHKQNYEAALQALIQLDLDLAPKQQQIPVVMKKRDLRND